jgi:hypothetical protein
VRLVVGIPTRNRPDLAAAAIASAARTSDPRLALVVSDNSTDPDASERVRRLCDEHAGVTYLRPPEALSMPEHWEWLARRIREVAEPTHLAYLSDRMVFRAGGLAALLAVAERHPGRVVSFPFDRVEDWAAPVALVQTEWSGRLVELDARRVIELASGGVLYAEHLPRMLNSVAPVETLDAIAARYGDVFASTTSPDYGFAFRALAVGDTLLYLDRPCVIQYAFHSSNGFTFLRGVRNDASSDFERRLARPVNVTTPEPRLRTFANAMFEEYCLASEQGGGDRFPPLDRRRYLAENAESARWMTEPLRGQTEELLRQAGWTRAARARHALRERLERRRHRARHPREEDGAPDRRPRFADAAAAIAHADAHPRPPAPRAWHVETLERNGAVLRALPAP